MLAVVAVTVAVVDSGVVVALVGLVCIAAGLAIAPLSGVV